MGNLLKVCALLFCFSGAFSLNAQTAADKDAVLQFVRSGFEAYDAYNAKLFASHYSSDAQFVTPDGALLQGREAIEAAHTEAFKTMGNVADHTYKWTGETVEFYGPDMARVVIQNSETMKVGDKVQSQSAIVTILVARKSGKWEADFTSVNIVAPTADARK